jgi:ribokinase
MHCWKQYRKIRREADGLLKRTKGREDMKIAVVGSINMDQTVMASRIPHAGETVTGTGLKYVPGGKGANQAVAMARLGADVEMFGCVGDDNAGRELTDNLRNNGVGTSRIGRVQDQPTGMAVITVAEGDNTIVIIAGANSEVTVDYIRSVQDALLEAGMVLLQHEIPQKTIDYVICLCSEHGITVMLNPAPARKRIFRSPPGVSRKAYHYAGKRRSGCLYRRWKTHPCSGPSQSCSRHNRRG